jgi:hypothetical protein
VAVLSDFYLPKGLPPETGEKRKENHVFFSITLHWHDQGFFRALLPYLKPIQFRFRELCHWVLRESEEKCGQDVQKAYWTKP